MRSKREHLRFVVTIAPAILSTAASSSFAMPAPPADVEFFERKIRPVLDANCFECHADANGATKGGLALDSRWGWEKGGDSGAAIVPGDVEKSLLLRAVKYADPEVHMPPRGKLPESVIQDIEQWIAMGAPDPRDAAPPQRAAEKKGVDFEAARDHWSFRAITDPVPPELADAALASWVRDPLDRFVAAEFAKHSLTPAPDADRRTWLRRVSLDLTGLPPTPDELAAFENDSGADAHERVVDRLLASPHYGERFARMWLDLARYADSNGLDENLAHAHAWRYRDYVVRSFNADKPFDRFVTEQIAGDLLPEPEGEGEDAKTRLRDQLCATGFLVLGPKMLAEQDKEKLVIDTVDEQIDVVSKTFLGVTISCARCHDHKFDPITQRDYYALAGIFRSTSTFDDLGFVSKWRVREVATRQEIAQRDDWRKRREIAVSARDAIVAQGRKERTIALLSALPAAVAAAQDAIAAARVVEAESFTASNLRVDHESYGTPEVGIVHTHQGGQQFAEYSIDLPAAGRYALEVRYASGQERPVRVLADGVEIAARALNAETGGFDVAHRKWETVASFDAATPHVTLRLERMPNEPQHFPHVDTLLLRADDGAAWPSSTADVESEFARATALWLLGGGDRTLATRTGELQTALTQGSDTESELGDASIEALRKQLLADHGPIPPGLRNDTKRFSGAISGSLAAAQSNLDDLDRSKPADFDHAMAVVDDKPTELAVHIRGSHLNKEPVTVPRAAPAIFDPLVKLGSISPDASGRLEFANWLTAPENPLTARVIANRVWSWHFGFGLSRSPSNVGLRGESPSHPELLDYLARELVRGGWSLKALHRRIVLSSTYRQDDLPSSDILHDPENRLLTRFPRLRLDAEQLRDSILAIAGTLDRSIGGTLLKTSDRDYVTNDQSSDRAQYDVMRRTIYLPIIRNAMYEFLSTFDYADPSVPIEQRPRSVIASQALWLMNSPFVLTQSERLAARLRTSATDDSGFVTAAYREVLLRAPSDDERARALSYLLAAREMLAAAGDQRDVRVDTSFCQALFASSEFLHVE